MSLQLDYLVLMQIQRVASQIKSPGNSQYIIEAYHVTF